jgi:hypothetical protein
VPDLIRLVLGSSTLNAEMVTYKNSSGQTLLHLVASRLALGHHLPNHSNFYDLSDEGTDPIAWRSPFNPDNQKHPWRVLLRDILSAGPFLHATDNHGRTPLSTLIRETLQSYSDQKLRNFRALSQTLELWLVELYKAGVPLEHHGNQEATLSPRERVNQSTCR